MRFWNRFRSEQKSLELEEEIQSHLAMAIQERIQNGEDPAQAKEAVYREFGNQALVLQTTQDQWNWHLLDSFLLDIKYGIRGIRNYPGVTAIVVLSFMLGIGANLSIFSLMYSVMLRPLSVEHPEQLVELLQKYPGEPRGNGYWTPQSYEYYRDNNHVFSGLMGMAISPTAKVRLDHFEDQTAITESVTENYFELLGIKPFRGRLFESGDRNSQINPAVISQTFQDKYFSPDEEVIGRKMYINGAPVTVVGIISAEYTGFQSNQQTSIWLPQQPQAGLFLIGRLKPGISLEQARSEMTVLYPFTIAERMTGNFDPQVQKLKIELESARSGFNNLTDRIGKPISALMALAATLLLLTCMNVAGLLLTRGLSRQKELAVKLGLGAGRWRLIRQSLTEAVLLSIFGTLPGIAVAYLGTISLLKILASGRPHEQLRILIHPDQNLILFAVAIALLTGVLSGIIPTLSIFRSDPASLLQTGGRATETHTHRILGKSLVAAQIAFSLLLLTTGSVFLLHLNNLKSSDLGFRRNNILLINIDSSKSGYNRERLANVFHELLDKFQTIPGVASASLSAPTPIQGAGASGFANTENFIENSADRHRVSINWIGPQYFRTLHTPILSGREFSFHDSANSDIAIISQAFAHHYFGERNPLGKKITLSGVTATPGQHTYEIVGISGNTNYAEIIESPQQIIYLPAFRADGVTRGTVLIQTETPPYSILPAVHKLTHDVSSSLSIQQSISLEDQIDASIVPERTIAVLSGYFAVLGSMLAGVGLFGLLIYTVVRRTSEIGIRMALGATPYQVSRLVLRDVLIVSLSGLIAAVPFALWAHQLILSAFQNIPAHPKPIIGLGTAGILLTILVASLIPVYRVTHINPTEALRHE